MGYKIRGKKIYVTGTVDGQHYRLSTGKEATALNISWIEKNHREVLLKLIVASKPQFSNNFVEYGQNSLDTNAYSRKTNTIVVYKQLFDRHIAPYFKQYNLQDIKPSHVKKWHFELLQKKLSHSTIKLARAVLNGIMVDAKMDELIVSNPISLVKLPKQPYKEEVVPFTLDEVKLLISACNGWFKSFMTVAFFTGMRTGELMGLKWEDIDFNSKKIQIKRTISRGLVGTPKTGKSRLIDMLPVVEKSLKDAYRATGLKYEYVFLSPKNRPYANQGTIISTNWKPLLKSCGLMHRRLYDTRHTFATMMLTKGEDIVWVSRMLGHAKVSTTFNFYIKYIPNDSKKRASFLDDFSTEIAQQTKQERVQRV